ncbi:hypothetical protein BU204_36165 [Actinophytocola xanthii]|uniref:N-acetyltransferase domain-containing protein n=2 Tax=Actinophytocola xanthii TaxID=1912961 RepID=A0A1Q8BXA5_9PSEU|nr:hypothetical protein BU204_36165 [Actinophytocola xanthii]
MDVQTYEDPAEFRAAVGDFYLADPVRHTLAVTVLDRYLDDPSIDPVMFTVHHQGALCGVGLRTPPWPLIVSGLPPSTARAAVELLADLDPDLPGVNGPRELAEVFAVEWAALTGAGLREVMAGRLYALGELRPPAVSGAERVAIEADVELLTRWRSEFTSEALGHEHVVRHAEEILRGALRRGEGVVLWEDAGEPVAWATASVPTGAMSRIGPVFTPPDLRNRGYGSAVTAAAARWAGAAGAEHVLLFTDLANPTSNSIYQKIGFRPVFDTTEIEFTAPA